MVVKTTPKSSLCDSCKNAGIIEGGYASFSDGIDVYDCPQRYCSVLTISISFGGKQECVKHLIII